MPRRIAIYYFSGTGNTRYVSRLLADELATSGAAVDLFAVPDILKSHNPPRTEDYDLVGISHPLHGWGAPRTVYSFIKTLPRADAKPAFLFRTAAGRESLNNGASSPVISALRKKGYRVFYDRAFMMPSNWVVGYPREFAKALCNAAAAKVKIMAAELLEGRERKVDCGSFISRLAYLLWHTEDFGSRFFGKDLHATKKCNRCGKCVRECPMSNISDRNGAIRFGWNCVWCMHCVYSCPRGAITPWVEKFVVVKGGYDVTKLVEDKSLTGECTATGAKGYFERHRRYLDDPEL